MIRKILLGLVLLVIISLPSKAQNEHVEFYCFYQGTETEKPLLYSLTEKKNQNTNILNRCGQANPLSVEISHELYSELKDIKYRFLSKEEERNALVFHFNKYNGTIATDLKGNQLEKKAKTTSNQISSKKFTSEDSKFSKKCEGGIFSSGYKRGTKEFDDCINKEEKLAALDEQKKQIINDEKNKKVQQKQELDQSKNKEEQIKFSKMKPEDRHAYTCAEKFNFRKGSDKFKDCVFEMYKVETELEKLELQKKIIEANLEVARVKERTARTEQDKNTALSERQTLAQERTAAAAAQQARIADFESSQRMIDDGLALLRGDRNLAGQVRAPRTRTSCTNLGGFITCN